MLWKTAISALFLSLLIGASAKGADGFAQNITGGSSGAQVVVSNEKDLAEYLTSLRQYIIIVHGSINLTKKIQPASDKTLMGDDSGAAITGQPIEFANGQKNFIVKNLNFPDSYSESINIINAAGIFITECTFTDNIGGMINIKNGDNVTISWCVFRYSTKPGGFAHVISDSSVTLHHNWYDGCDRDMPLAAGSIIHMYNNYLVYNNYFVSDGNSSGTVAGSGTQLLSENNYYENMNDPVCTEGSGKIRASGNIYDKCSGIIDEGNDTVFYPPYYYSPMFTSIVPQVVRRGAGGYAGWVRTGDSCY